VVAAEDVLQQTFIQVFRDIGSYRPRAGASFWSWLKAIADHRVYDAVRTARRKKRGGNAARVELHCDGGSIADLIEMLSTGGRSPSQSVAKREAIQAIRIAVAELPADQRLAVQLRCLDGRSLDEVAAALVRTPNAVRGLLHRAKQQLREVLGRSSLWLSNK
jgi:RNA polymerase sigma-70 factor (ECF subfamily)